MQESSDDITCQFVNGLTGTMYDKTIIVSKKNTGSSLLLKFCEIHDFCIYQIKLMYNDKILVKNKYN